MKADKTARAGQAVRDQRRIDKKAASEAATGGKSKTETTTREALKRGAATAASIGMCEAQGFQKVPEAPA